MEENPIRSKASPRHFPKWCKGIVLSAVGLLIVTGVMVTFHHPTSTQAVNTVTAGDWPMYMHDAGRSSNNRTETIINQSSASQLKQRWAYTVGAAIFSQPVEAGGLIYWGSFDGYEHATNLSGQQVWSQKLGGTVTTCAPVNPFGIVSSAAVVNGVVYVGGADHALYALNATSGQILWKTLLGAPNSNTFLWDSPLVVNNNVYIGTATTGEGVGCNLIAGQLYELNALNGSTEHIYNSVPSGCVGGGIWSSPVFDASDGSLYFTAGTQGNCQTDHISIGIVKLNASTLVLESSWQIPVAQRLTSDADFGATPTLFTANGQNLVGAVDKNGVFYAFNRASLSNGPVWQKAIAGAGACPQCGQGSISSAAWDGSQLYVAGGSTNINGVSCGGSLRALNPTNGGFNWQVCLPKTVLGPITYVPGVIAVVDGTALTLFNASTGATLFNDNTHKYYGSPSISNGVLYVGSPTGSLYAYGLGTNPTPPPTPTPPPVSGPVSKLWYFAEGRVGAGFSEFLTLGNPTTTDCQVSITYLTQPDSGPAGSKTVSVDVPPSTRVTRWVDGDLGTSTTGHGISDAATVSVNSATTPTCRGIVAERPMYFHALGTNSGSDVLGVTKPGTSFYFADLAVGSQPGGGTSSSFLPVLNPGSTAATVTATYYAGGKTVGTQTLTVAAGSRGTIFPSHASPSLPPRVSVVLSSSQPVVAERPTYFSGINGGNAGLVSGGADVIGVQQLSTDWLFAEGYTGGRFQENLVLANLDPASKPASVTIRLEYDTGASRAFTVTVNPLSQLIWNVNANSAGAGTSQSVSAEITSTGAAIAVEREMYFGYDHVGDGRSTRSTGGTDVLGQVGPATKSAYSFAEGYTNLGYDEWVTIQNPTNAAETVTLTVSNGVGTVYTFAVPVVAHSRSTVDMVAIVQQHLFHGGNGYQGYEISLAVQSSSGPFVVERPMYWNASGTQGGSDVIGYSGG